ncbi:MAG: hypothetical protein EZS28_016703 [Streblomastix strix]|uniref:Uncharacterized protein n=1 Tax=Streblomastix strix TaxID=222440 RepID=A0A5J4VYR0_9EUKA|nr:MAG: hypothetical protein EZS28_016703 [Streblomastix strix]
MTVPSDCNVINGLPGLGSDILLDVLSEFRLVPDAASFFGINSKTLNLKNHARFCRIVETLYYPINILNLNPDIQNITDIDGIQKMISNLRSNYNCISLDQVLEDGIWQMECEFKDTRYYSTVGIVRDSYEIPINDMPEICLELCAMKEHQSKEMLHTAIIRLQDKNLIH